MSALRIPITMCHGVSASGDKPLTAERFRRYFSIARRLDFTSINYEDLAAWREKRRELPARPIMFDFDHPVTSIRYTIHDIMREHGYTGTLFVNTGPMEKLYSAAIPPREQRDFMTWEEIRELVAAGWHIGGHTHTHPNLSKLSVADPTGEAVRKELQQNDEMLAHELGRAPRDFAFTGTSWSSAAEREVMRRYRFGRLWIVGSKYQADGKEIRYADLIGVAGADEADGGPPRAARYITGETPAYRLPSMEMQALIYGEDAFEAYLRGALDE